MTVGLFTLRGKPFMPQLETTPGFVKCQIRDRWLVANREEWVRQEALALLKQELSGVYPHKCRILVETRDIDIALQARAEPVDFQPPIAPTFIIETKHRDVDPLDSPMHEQQLFKYLQRTGCSHGALINGRSGWLYKYEKNSSQKCSILDSIDLVHAILECHHHISAQLREEEQLFIAARRGHFASFQQLIERYGKHAQATIRFRFEQRGRLVDESGFLFRFLNNSVQFMPRGREQSEPSSFQSQSFRSLLAIVALGQAL